MLISLVCLLQVWPDGRALADGTREFPLGVYEDAALINGDVERFKAILTDIKAHGLDSIMMVNGRIATDTPLLNVSDQMGMNVYLGPAIDLERDWFSTSVPAASAKAQEAAGKVVSAFSPHVSAKGYYLTDEPDLNRKEKIRLLAQAFHSLDPSRPTFPVLAGTDRVGPIFKAAQPDLMVLDVYPCAYQNPVGDFTMRGFGYSNYDFTSYLRMVTRDKPNETALWLILQTHRLGTGGAFSLREPTRAELRSEAWLALGEGAQGLFWFIYSSEQGWRGLKENTEAFAEIGRLAKRISPLRATLQTLQPGPDVFSVSGAGPRPHFIRHFLSKDKARHFLILVNRDAMKSQRLKIKSLLGAGTYRNLEVDGPPAVDGAIEFAPGDGGLFEFTPAAKP